MKQIKIGDSVYEIDYTQESADAIINKIIKWMEHPSHYASSHGEGIMQDDNCLIDAPELIASIVDEILSPEWLFDLPQQ